MFFIILLFLASSVYFYWKSIKEVQRRKEAELLINAFERKKDIYYYMKVSPQLEYAYLSKAIDKYFGEGTQEANIRDPLNAYLQLIHPDDAHIALAKINGTANYDEPLTVRLKIASGEYQWFEEYTSPVYKNGLLVAIHGVYRNIHEKIKLQQSITYKATHDALTNVKNRLYFEEQLAQCRKSEKSSGWGIIICDLDDLKRINDAQGHKQGDLYIQNSATLLKNTVADKGEVCRIGGDEFAILLTHTTAEQVAQLVTDIGIQIQEHNIYNPHMPLYMSIGYSFTDQPNRNLDDLFIQADHAMYANKLARKVMV